MGMVGNSFIGHDTFEMVTSLTSHQEVLPSYRICQLKIKFYHSPAASHLRKPYLGRFACLISNAMAITIN